MAIQDDLPRSRITLTYRTTINGQPEDVDLPFRMLVLGDFSQVETRTDELDARTPRKLDGKNLDDVMKDMKLKCSFSVANKINPDPAVPDDQIPVNLDITSMKSFDPDAIAEQVPQLKALLLLRTLIREMQTQVDNRREVRNQIVDLFSTKDQQAVAKGSTSKLDALLAELTEFKMLQVPGT